MIQISACCVDATSAFFFKKLSLMPACAPQGRRLRRRAVSTHYPKSIWIRLVWFYHPCNFRGALSVPFPSLSQFLNVLSALAGVSCVGQRILCPACPLGLAISTSTCIQGPVLSCRVGVCNFYVKSYTHLLIHLKVVRIIYWSLRAKWKEKAKFKDVNMLVIEGMW